MQAALGHALQRVRRQLHRLLPEFRLPALQGGGAKEKIEHRGPREFRRTAEAAPQRVVRVVEILEALLERLAGRFMQRPERTLRLVLVLAACHGVALERRHHFRRAGLDLVALLPPVAGDGVEH